MSTSKFEQRLEAYYERHRNHQLSSRLDELGERLGETMLLCAVYEEVTGTPISPEAEAVNAVQQLRTAWNNNEFEEVDAILEDVESSVNAEVDRISGKIQSEKHDILVHLRALKALNQKVALVDESRVSQLESDLFTLDSVLYQTDLKLHEQEQTVREHIRDEVLQELEAVEDQLMGEFLGSSAESHVRALISGTPLSLSSMDGSEISELRKSKLGPYLSLKIDSRSTDSQ